MTLQKASRYIYVFGLCLFAAALPLSKAFLTISQMVLGLSWVLNFNYKEKTKLFFENRIFWWFPALLILHFIFLINTENYTYAWHDIVIKIPLFVIPFTIATTAKPNKKELTWILGIFCAAVISGALIGIGKYCAAQLGWIEQVLEHRNLSHFTSHIRFSLMVCFCIALLCYAYKEKMLSLWFCLLNAALLLICLILMEAITGLITLMVIGLPLFMLLAGWNYKNHMKKIVLVSVLLVLSVGGYFYYEIRDVFSNKDKNETLSEWTMQHHHYYHDLLCPFKENGHYIWRNVCESELRTSWNSRSKLSFDSADKKGQYLYSTLLRYLTSLGLKKDAAGMAQLSGEDIANIENGEANAINAKSNPVRKRIRELLWEIDNYFSGGVVNNNSLTQRFVYWKTGWEIIDGHFLWGVGTGDVQDTFNTQYDKDKSTLIGDLRRHTHNQYLTFWISFGIFGLLFFLIMLLHLYQYTFRLEHPFPAQIFAVIIFISMLSEDTLETQAGVSFFVFFFALFWVGKKSA